MAMCRMNLVTFLAYVTFSLFFRFAFSRIVTCNSSLTYLWHSVGKPLGTSPGRRSPTQVSARAAGTLSGPDHALWCQGDRLRFQIGLSVVYVMLFSQASISLSVKWR